VSPPEGFVQPAAFGPRAGAWQHAGLRVKIGAESLRSEWSRRVPIGAARECIGAPTKGIE
jgi:hypothetical protein